jgi:hypothetical protein
MPSPLTILLITLGTGGDIPFTPAIARAAREALGPDVHLVERRVDAMPSDTDAVALAEQAHANAVVEVTWITPDHLRATIRMERQTTGRWLDREIGFRVVDDPAERSRTVGFAIASMIPERAGHPEALPAATPAEQPPSATETPRRTETPTKPAAPPPRPAKAPPRAEAREPTETSEEGPPEEDHDVTAPHTPEAPVRHSRAVTALAVIALGLGDGSDGVGGALEYRNVLAGPLWLRFGASARAGVDPPAGITARFFSGAAGVAFRGWVSTNGRTALGLRLDALVLFDELERRSAGATTTRNKVLPGADLLAEASHFFTGATAAVLGVGAEAMFGQTEVVAAGRPLTTFRPVRPLVEAGLRIGF